MQCQKEQTMIYETLRRKFNNVQHGKPGWTQMFRKHY